MLVKDVNFEELYNLTKSIHSYKLKANTNELKDLVKSTEKTLKDKLHSIFSKAELLYDIRKQFAAVPLVRGDNGLVNSYATVLALKELNFNLFSCILFISNHASRSDLYYMYDTTLNAKFGNLNPIFMAAHKKYNNVMYNEWDRDKATYPAIAVGTLLWDYLVPYLEPIPELDDNLLELRSTAMEESKANNPSSYFLKAMIYVKDNKKIRVPTLISHIKAQFWVANVSKRNKYMILDTVDWDNIPEAFDEDNYVSPAEKAIKKDKEDSMLLPW